MNELNYRLNFIKPISRLVKYYIKKIVIKGFSRIFIIKSANK